LADLEDLLEELAELAPAEQAELAARLGIQLPAAAAPEFVYDEYDEPDEYEINEALHELKWERRDLDRDALQWIGSQMAEGASLEQAVAAYDEDDAEQAFQEDVARIQAEAEAKEGRALLPSEERSLFEAWQRSEAEGRPELDWRPLDLTNDSEARNQYLAERLNGDDQGAVQHSLEQRADNNGDVAFFDLDGSSDDRVAYLEARLADAVEPITDGPPEHDAPEGAE
jgi:hypothetical protein